MSSPKEEEKPLDEPQEQQHHEGDDGNDEVGSLNEDTPERSLMVG